MGYYEQVCYFNSLITSFVKGLISNFYQSVCMIFCSIKKSIKISQYLQEKLLCWSFLFNEVAKGLELNLKETLTQVFPSEYCEIFKNTFFTEYLLATTSQQMKV